MYGYVKRFTALPLTVVLVLACSESPTDPSLRPQFSEGNAIFDLTTPPAPQAVQVAGSMSILVTWSPLLGSVEAQCDGFAALNTSNTATTCRGVHFELYRNGALIADVAGNEYTDADLPTGTYSYQVKSKGLEQTPREDSYTYHSLISPVSNVVTLGAVACSAPSVSAALTAGAASYTRDNSTVAVTFGGVASNWAGCPGAAAEYRVQAYNTNDNSLNAEHSTSWASLLSAFTGAAYSITLPITRNNQNLRFEFEVQVSHTDVAGWFAAPAPAPSVTIVQPPPKK